MSFKKLSIKKQLAKANCSEEITSMNVRSITISWVKYSMNKNLSLYKKLKRAVIYDCSLMVRNKAWVRSRLY